MENTIVAEFIPILFLFASVVYTKLLLEFSTTFLGKLVFLFIILYYTTLNKVYGLLSVAIVVFVLHYAYLLEAGKEGFGKEDFIKAHCENGKLKYKMATVTSEMAEHIFPEIKYNHPEYRCHPCDPACEYSILEEKLRNEADILMPKPNPDITIPEKTILDYWKLPIASLWVKTEPFSYL